MNPRDSLVARVRAFVDADLAGKAGPESFEVLASALHAYQATMCPIRKTMPVGPFARAADVPAVPTGLFRRLPVGTCGLDAPVQFHTSGTTGPKPGVHRLWDTALLDHAARGDALRSLPAVPRRGVALLRDPAKDPHSSLSHMVSTLFGETSWHLGSDLDVLGLRRAVETASEPLFVATTGFSLAAWLAEPVPHLPSGSVLMVTGGFKGRMLNIDPDRLLDEAAKRLRPDHVVREYGMTELSSMGWSGTRGPYRLPGWLRAVAVSPLDGTPRPDGERGQLRFVDLCNVDGSVAIETMDVGVAGPGWVELEGRLPGAELRGCSLAAEDLVR